MSKQAFNCEYCADEFSLYPSTVKYREGRGNKIRFCSVHCYRTATVNEPKGRAINPKGYWVREGYKIISTGPNVGKYEHRILMENIVGRPLLSNEVVHHKNGNGLDNGPENLELLDKREHMSRHAFAKRLEFNCDVCAETFTLRESQVKHRHIQGYSPRFCSVDCHYESKKEHGP